MAGPGDPYVLFDVQRDEPRVLSPHPYRYVRFRSAVVDGSESGRQALRVEVESFEPPPHHYAVRAFLGDENRPRAKGAERFGSVVVRARTADAGTEERLEVALVDTEGRAWGAVVPLTNEWRDLEVRLAELRPVSLALLPRPYPEFLPNEWRPASTGSSSATLDLRELDGVQLRMGINLFSPGEPSRGHGFEVERISLHP